MPGISANEIKAQGFDLLNSKVLILLKEGSLTYLRLGSEISGELCSGEWREREEVDAAKIWEALTGVNIFINEGAMTYIPVEDILYVLKAY